MFLITDTKPVQTLRLPSNLKCEFGHSASRYEMLSWKLELPTRFLNSFLVPARTNLETAFSVGAISGQNIIIYIYLV